MEEPASRAGKNLTAAAANTQAAAALHAPSQEGKAPLSPAPQELRGQNPASLKAARGGGGAGAAPSQAIVCLQGEDVITLLLHFEYAKTEGFAAPLASSAAKPKSASASAPAAGPFCLFTVQKARSDGESILSQATLYGQRFNDCLKTAEKALQKEMSAGASCSELPARNFNIKI